MSIASKIVETPAVWIENSSRTSTDRAKAHWLKKLLLAIEYETYCTNDYSRLIVHQYHGSVLRTAMIQDGLAVHSASEPRFVEWRTLPGYANAFEVWRIESEAHSRAAILGMRLRHRVIQILSGQLRCTDAKSAA